MLLGRGLFKYVVHTYYCYIFITILFIRVHFGLVVSMHGLETACTVSWHFSTPSVAWPLCWKTMFPFWIFPPPHTHTSKLWLVDCFSSSSRNSCQRAQHQTTLKRRTAKSIGLGPGHILHWHSKPLRQDDSHQRRQRCQSVKPREIVVTLWVGKWCDLANGLHFSSLGALCTTSRSHIHSYIHLWLQPSEAICGSVSSCPWTHADRKEPGMEPPNHFRIKW